uniref:Uncharacterized protein n=1 Tax=viral metagenome TaxID=1070528 RepID=A0A6C0KL84_9ZZZZ
MGKRSKKKTKSSKLNLLNHMMHSSFTLVLIVFCALVYVLNLWHKQENDSLFLFIVFSFIIYTRTNHVVYILGLPIIIVQLLISMRRVFLNEPFSDTTDASLNIICGSHFNNNLMMSEADEIRICKDTLKGTSDSSFESWLIEESVGSGTGSGGSGTGDDIVSYQDVSYLGSYGGYIAKNITEHEEKNRILYTLGKPITLDWDVSFSNNKPYSDVVSRYIEDTYTKIIQGQV